MYEGHQLNKTEKRQAWHVKLRDFECLDEVAHQVSAVRQRIKEFSDQVR